MREQLQALVEKWDKNAELPDKQHRTSEMVNMAAVWTRCANDLREALLAAPGPPGTFRLTCGCVSHLCEQHQKEMAAPPVQGEGTPDVITVPRMVLLKAASERDWWHREWHRATGIPCDGSEPYCPLVRREKEQPAEAAPTGGGTPVEALREALKAFVAHDTHPDACSYCNDLVKMARRALATQEKPPAPRAKSVRYCGHEVPVGKACPICCPAQPSEGGGSNW